MATPSDAPARLQFRRKAVFFWKTALLLVTTLALIPILLYQNILGAELYLWFLVVVHVGGLIIFAYGVKREDIAPSTWGFYGRLTGLGFAVALLYLASKGLQGGFGTALFWFSLFAIWALHTGGLALLHLRGAAEPGTCPLWPVRSRRV